MDEDDLAKAIRREPKGKVCAACKGPNTWADDLGWFYVHIPLGYKPVCRRCWNLLIINGGDR